MYIWRVNVYTEEYQRKCIIFAFYCHFLLMYYVYCIFFWSFFSAIFKQIYHPDIFNGKAKNKDKKKDQRLSKKGRRRTKRGRLWLLWLSTSHEIHIQSPKAANIGWRCRVPTLRSRCVHTFLIRLLCIIFAVVDFSFQIMLDLSHNKEHGIS